MEIAMAAGQAPQPEDKTKEFIHPKCLGKLSLSS